MFTGEQELFSLGKFGDWMTSRTALLDAGQMGTPDRLAIAAGFGPA
jgi:hypothetical protein